jgi:hypothetical protein
VEEVRPSGGPCRDVLRQVHSDADPDHRFPFPDDPYRGRSDAGHLDRSGAFRGRTGGRPSDHQDADPVPVHQDRMDVRPSDRLDAEPVPGHQGLRDAGDRSPSGRD